MKLTDLIRTLECRVIVDGAKLETWEVTEVVASDLMSDILVVEKENFIILTSLTSEQVVRTADLVGSYAILLVNGKTPQPAMKKLAAEQGITILSTPHCSFRACVALGRILQVGDAA